MEPIAAVTGANSGIGLVRTNLGNPLAPIKALVGLFFLSAEHGARTSLAVATDPRFEGMNRHYFAKSEPADRKLSATARDDAAAGRLWDASAALVGL